jgi:hypothetical protein
MPAILTVARLIPVIASFEVFARFAQEPCAAELAVWDFCFLTVSVFRQCLLFDRVKPIQ